MRFPSLPFAVSATALLLSANAWATCSLHVTTTLFPAYDFVRTIGGDDVCVKLLLKPGQESHTYEPSPGDIRRIAKSDLLVYTGGENDVWVKGLLKSFGKKAPHTVALMDLVPTVEEEIVEGMEADHDHDHAKHDHAKHEHDHAHHDHDHHDHDHAKHDEHEHHHHAHAHAHAEHDAEADEHVWLSPKNARLIVKGLTDELIELDPKHQAQYEARYQAYDKKLEALDNAYEAMREQAKRNVLIFGDRFPFRYLVKDYRLQYFAAFPGCSAQVQPSAATVAFLSDKAKALSTPVVFKCERSNDRLAKTIASAAGAKVETLHAVHNLSTEELARGETYLSLMEHNLKVLQGALQ